MKKVFTVLLMGTLFFPVAHIRAQEIGQYYSRDQIDSIVAAEVKRQVDTLLIFYKIEKAFNSKLETYIEQQNLFITKHDDEMSDRYNWIGVLFTIFVACFGVVGPLVTNKKFETQIKKEFDTYKKQIEENLRESEKTIDDSVTEFKGSIKEMIGNQKEEMNKSKEELDKHVEEVEEQLSVSVKELENRVSKAINSFKESVVSELTLIKERIQPPTAVKDDASEEEKKIHNLLSKAFDFYSNKEYEKAFKLYLDVAKGGNATAQFNIGKMYYDGCGVERDYKKAFEWFEKSAQQGNAQAQLKLGEMYEFGRGVSQNNKKAYYWYELSAKQGYANAQYNFGELYAEGRVGLACNPNQAVDWFRKAAGKGHQLAKIRLRQLGDF